MTRNRLALCLQAEPGAPLLIGRDPVIGATNLGAESAPVARKKALRGILAAFHFQSVVWTKRIAG
jgi:hypothetical protein